MTDAELALRSAVGKAFDEEAIAPPEDIELVEDFLYALKKCGYLVIREFNGVHPEQPKE